MSNLGKQFTLYHRTDPATAGKIIESKKLKPSKTEDQVFLSTKVHGGAKGFGRSVVEVSVDPRAKFTNMSSNPDVHKDEAWYGVEPRHVQVLRAWSEI
jgi:hypothetical protein